MASWVGPRDDVQQTFRRVRAATSDETGFSEKERDEHIRQITATVLESQGARPARQRQKVPGAGVSAALEAMEAGLKVRALLWPLDQYANQASALIAEHPELRPEIEAANAHIVEAGGAIQRAINFLNAKMDAETAA